jgi:hypothetical protein
MEPPPPLQLQDLPLCVLARIVRRVARADARAATAAACSCRLLAAVAADELLVFAPLCRELAAACGAGVCVGAWSARQTRRPHAAAYVALRLGVWLTESLWRGAGDDAQRLFVFFWTSDGAVACTELDNAAGCIVRRVCDCRFSSDALRQARDGGDVMDVLRLDLDRCALRAPPVRAVQVSAVAATIAGKCASPVGSPSSNFALEYLQHTHTMVQSRDSRRRARSGGQASLSAFALVRCGRLGGLSLVLSAATVAAPVEPVAGAAMGVTQAPCSTHAACSLTLHWLRGGRLLASCTHDGGPPRDVLHIALPSP